MKKIRRSVLLVAATLAVGACSAAPIVAPDCQDPTMCDYTPGTGNYTPGTGNYTPGTGNYTPGTGNLGSGI
jgi:hypothetical protein